MDQGGSLTYTVGNRHAPETKRACFPVQHMSVLQLLLLLLLLQDQPPLCALLDSLLRPAPDHGSMEVLVGALQRLQLRCLLLQHADQLRGRTMRSYRFPEVALGARGTDCSFAGRLGAGRGRVAGREGGGGTGGECCCCCCCCCCWPGASNAADAVARRCSGCCNSRRHSGLSNLRCLLFCEAHLADCRIVMPLAQAYGACIVARIASPAALMRLGMLVVWPFFFVSCVLHSPC